jgi:hypothetical protein
MSRPLLRTCCAPAKEACGAGAYALEAAAKT